MSTLIPPIPVGPIPSGTDVRDLRPWLNSLRESHAKLTQIVRGLCVARQPVIAPPRDAAALPWSDFVRVAGRKITITGTRARYIHITLSPAAAAWSDVDMDPMPDGVEIVDTYVQEFHIPRLG